LFTEQSLTPLASWQGRAERILFHLNTRSSRTETFWDAVFWLKEKGDGTRCHTAMALISDEGLPRVGNEWRNYVEPMGLDELAFSFS